MDLILSLDTASYNCSVALSNGEKVISSRSTDSHNHTQALPLMIYNLFKATGYDLKNLSAVAVNIGPGSYTGLRVGLATAKGICYSAGLPLIPVNGFTALAKEAIRQNDNKPGTYIVLGNNYRDGWYYAVYDEALNELLPMGSVTNIDNLLKQIHTSPVYVYSYTGDTNYQSNQTIIRLPAVTFNASHIVAIALIQLLKQINADIFSVQPIYINSIFLS